MNSRFDDEPPFSPLAGLSPAALAAPAKPTASTAPSITGSPKRTPKLAETTLRTRLHPDDKRRFESLCVHLSESLRATVRPSNLLRALLVLLHEHDTQLHAKARLTHGLVRPPNDDRQAVAEFERCLAVLIADAVGRRKD